MADLLGRLQAALGNAYRVERELGGGGMSRVFVATESALDRQVVIKVLAPDLAPGFNVERFRREIQLAAKLQHPHIVPLLSAGAAEGMLYYMMPLIEGESLRAKLSREGELPIPEAVRVLRDVADALAYAHEHGLVHRDIKPDNVLLSGKHAVVTDFGVSKALSTATGKSTTLTSIGVALGTPAYMAPEQAAAEPGTDHRADIYALGIVAYELLTGHAPFSGLTAQQVLAAHATQAPVPVTLSRATVPPALGALVMHCLEKHAADRPQTAAEVLHALEAMVTPSGGMTPTASVPPARRVSTGPLKWLAIGAGTAVVVGSAVYLLWPHQGRPLDPRVVAVVPFRVTGADPSLTYLREGMVDLLAAKLTGEGGPRATDPRATVSAWRQVARSQGADVSEDAALRLARGLGAGQLILGGIVGSNTSIVLNATLLAVPSGRSRAQASVEGSPDSLPALLDRLTAQLLARGAGETEQRLTSLTTTSLEALRAYVDGESEYRRGDYGQAARHLSRALQLDSTFALAALALVQTEGWGPPPPDFDRVQRLAWALRHHLSARDQVLLAAYLGPNGPVPTPEAEKLVACERAVEVVPDQPEAWYFLGDEYFHEGAGLGISDARERAAAAFRRAVSLDSTFAGPLEHLVILAAVRGDTAEVARFGRLYLSVVSGDPYTRWRMAMALKNPTMLRQARALIESGGTAVWGIGFNAWDDNLDLGDADRALAVFRRAASTASERASYFIARIILSFNRARASEALSALDTLAQSPSLVWGPAARWMRIGSALYWDGDTTAAAATVSELRQSADGPLAGAVAERSLQYGNTCWVEQWRLAHGETPTAKRAIERLQTASTSKDSAATVASSALCATVLEAWLASAERSPDASVRIAHLDSLMRTGPTGQARWGEVNGVLPFENLVVARLLAHRGEPGRALAALRRRGRGLSEFGTFLTTYLREEGKLAALTGDRAGAVKAYQRYLALRSDPEASLKPEVDRVRAELAKLVGEGATK